MDSRHIGPCCDQQQFCDGLARAEVDQTSNVRLVFYVGQWDVFGEIERIIVQRMIVPQAALAHMLSVMAQTVTPDAQRFASYWQSGVIAHA